MLVWIQQLKKKRITSLFLMMSVVIFFVFFCSAPVFAQTNVASGDVLGTEQFAQTTALSGGSFIVIVARIINVFFGLLGVCAVVIVLYGGYVYMTSGGAPDKVENAKKILLNGLIGLVIILSSWAIARFILQKLGEATGVAGLGGLLGNRGAQEFNDFGGTGSLGRIIRDHYPTRGERDVKRNTRIAITFNEPINPASIIQNTNNTCWSGDGRPTQDCERNGNEVQNPYFGDCFTPPGQAFNWETDCDRLNTDAIGIFPTSTTGVFNNQLQRKPDAPAPVEAYALAHYEDGAERNAYSFVFKPVNFLGDNLKKLEYTVGVSSNLEKKNGDRALNRLYQWNFQTDTTFDFEAPTLVVQDPSPNQLIPRNQVIQLVFSEPMDPITIQGVTAPNSPFNNFIFGNQNIQGEWRLSNGYRTAEFISSQPCGQNSCGDVMYCLPEVACAPGQDPVACVAQTEILVRTAQPLANNAFDAQPFTGITDLSGNALDGDADRVVDGKPNMPGDFRTIGEQERRADNASWVFRISNTIDRTPPVIENVQPSVDAEGVQKDDPVQLLFSKPLLHRTLRFLSLEEHPKPNQVDDIWYRATAERENGKDTVVLQHREFGPNGQDFFYFPSVSSAVKDLRQNCMYPGFGPWSEVKGQDTVCTVDANGNQNDCTPVIHESESDTGCAQTFDQEKTVQPNLQTCINELKAMSNREVQVNP